MRTCGERSWRDLQCRLAKGASLRLRHYVLCRSPGQVVIGCSYFARVWYVSACANTSEAKRSRTRERKHANRSQGKSLQMPCAVSLVAQQPACSKSAAVIGLVTKPWYVCPSVV